MARPSALNAKSLEALGTAKLALLVLDGIDRDAGFKRMVAAAVASMKKPKAVVALVDKRLAGLERARGFIDWERVKAFAADLDATVTTIVKELGTADPSLAAQSLLRFLATIPTVLERVDDSQGRVQCVYEAAIEALGPVASAMPDDNRVALPDRVMAALGDDSYGNLPAVIQAVAPHLGPETLKAWDARLSDDVAVKPGKVRQPDWEVASRRQNRLAARQMIAFVRHDLDAFATLEESKHPNIQNTLGLAQLFLDANRPAEALAWVRRNARGTVVKYSSAADMADRQAPRDYASLPRARLEGLILDALGEKDAAQTLRWSTFEATLDAEILRDHIERLGEFEEFDALDRAFEIATAAPNIHQALGLFITWPQLDRAAALVIKHRDRWDGRSYQVLVPAAEALEGDQQVAAALLYRGLVTAILTQGQSNAYAHGARYLAKLDVLADASDAAALPGVASHAAFKAAIGKQHARKSAFWPHVKDRVSR